MPVIADGLCRIGLDDQRMTGDRVLYVDFNDNILLYCITVDIIGTHRATSTPSIPRANGHYLVTEPRRLRLIGVVYGD